MGCRCSERAGAIVKGVKAAAQGDMAELTRQATIFRKSVSDDARDFSRKIAGARASLARR